MNRSVIADALCQSLHDHAERHAEESDRSSGLADDSVERHRVSRLHLAEYIEITTREISELKKRFKSLKISCSPECSNDPPVLQKDISLQPVCQ